MTALKSWLGQYIDENRFAAFGLEESLIEEFLERLQEEFEVHPRRPGYRCFGAWRPILNATPDLSGWETSDGIEWTRPGVDDLRWTVRPMMSSPTKDGTTEIWRMFLTAPLALEPDEIWDLETLAEAVKLADSVDKVLTDKLTGQQNYT